jgi:hypothetical protein
MLIEVLKFKSQCQFQCSYSSLSPKHRHRPVKNFLSSAPTLLNFPPSRVLRALDPVLLLSDDLVPSDDLLGGGGLAAALGGVAVRVVTESRAVFLLASSSGGGGDSYLF